MNVDGALPLVGAPLICDPALTNGEDRRIVLDNEENGSTHDWTKVVRNRRTPFQATDEGLQPTDVRKRRTPFQATDEGLQPTDGIRQSVSRSKGRHDEGTSGHVGPRKATRSRKERKVEKR
jgi:hypothetical protein